MQHDDPHPTVGARPTVEPRPSFEDVYRDRFTAMVRLAFVLVDTDEAAEEVVQDAFAGLYVRWHRVDDPVAYLRRSVMNGARGVLRRRRTARRHDAAALTASTAATTTATTAVDPAVGLGADDASSGLVGSDLGHVVEAVRRLPARQRAVVVLRYEAQLSEAEIARTLDMPLGTVKSTLHRALARLREEIQP